MDVNNATRAEGQIAPKASKKAFSKGIVELQEQGEDQEDFEAAIVFC